MERLTFEGNFCEISRCEGEYRMCSWCEDGACDARKVWERLKAYENLEEQGRLKVLPCRIGDTVYFRTYAKNATVDLGIHPHEVTNISVTITCGKGIHTAAISLSDFGKSVFMTSEEAEAALATATNVGCKGGGG